MNSFLYIVNLLALQDDLLIILSNFYNRFSTRMEINKSSFEQNVVCQA